MSDALTIRTQCRRCKRRGPAHATIWEARHAARHAGWRHHHRTGWSCAACQYTRINRRFKLGIAIPLGVANAAMMALLIIVAGETFGWWGA